jgi:hypothetical protein
MDEEEKRRRQEKIMAAWRVPQKPGVCDECGGPVMMPHTGICHPRLSHRLPQCMRCGTVYMGDDNALKETYEEYKERVGTFRVDI